MAYTLNGNHFQELHLDFHSTLWQESQEFINDFNLELVNSSFLHQVNSQIRFQYQFLEDSPACCCHFRTEFRFELTYTQVLLFEHHYESQDKLQSFHKYSTQCLEFYLKAKVSTIKHWFHFHLQHHQPKDCCC